MLKSKLLLLCRVLNKYQIKLRTVNWASSEGADNKIHNVSTLSQNSKLVALFKEVLRVIYETPEKQQQKDFREWCDGEEETTMTVWYWYFWCQVATKEASLFFHCASKEKVTQAWIYLYPLLVLATTNHIKHTLTCTSMSGTAQIMDIIFINLYFLSTIKFLLKDKRSFNYYFIISCQFRDVLHEMLM